MRCNSIGVLGILMASVALQSSVSYGQLGGLLNKAQKLVGNGGKNASNGQNQPQSQQPPAPPSVQAPATQPGQVVQAPPPNQNDGNVTLLSSDAMTTLDSLMKQAPAQQKELLAEEQAEVDDSVKLQSGTKASDGMSGYKSLV